jgi:predicted DsbA family dithiol-disulfide isomerase
MPGAGRRMDGFDQSAEADFVLHHRRMYPLPDVIHHPRHRFPVHCRTLGPRHGMRIVAAPGFPHSGEGWMKIEVWADIACPWCWIGETRLRRALEQRPDVQAEIIWRPYQLQPGFPPEGKPWDELVRTKFGGPERARGMFAHVASAGAEDGLPFDFERVSVAPNTKTAHRLVLFAQRHGKGMEMAEALFRAYFAEGRDVAKTGVLADVAASVGLDRDRVARFLAGSELVDEVDESQSEAAGNGINGVPFFVLEGKYAFSGAQPVDTFVTVVDQVLEREAAGG